MRLSSPFAVPFVLLTGSHATPQVKIGKTTITERDISTLQLDFFGGIPFVEPPLGKLRLQSPVLKTHLDINSFNASDYGPGCLQPVRPGSDVPYPEDCLTINVLRPSSLAQNAKLAVLFWVYGGGFQGGASSKFNGSAIVAQSVARGTPLIYVNFNYSLGPLGFPQGQEAADQKALNLALKDEIAALEWVQKNIGAFGGDNNKVTVFGESAGAIMFSILFLNSPLENLARGVILESGSQATSFNFPPQRRENDWKNFVLGVTSCAVNAGSQHSFDCFRNANTSEILPGILNAISKAPEQFAFDPTIDGHGTLFAFPSINSEAQIRDSIIANLSPPVVPESRLENTVDKILQLYPDIPALGSPFITGNETFGLSIGDILFNSQRRFFQQTAARAGVKSWGYIFTQPQAAQIPSLGITHISEVVYVYGMPKDQSPSSLKLSAMMIDYWVSFATSLNPNDGKGMQRMFLILILLPVRYHKYSTDS
ncbi:Lipase 1 [Leucoagaricus sp. SymC.cos]|nr:Lipase 1 [Leucoagaricus sp. SymC.cos]